MTTYAEPTAPKHQSYRSGCKVSWKYYDSREDAELAAKAAEHDANIQLSRGYDFGYCWPGSIGWAEPDSEHGGENGRWEVCFP
jgi:hypothetical protein